MRKLLILAIVISAISTAGQTSCEIKRDEDKFTGKISIKTPLECRIQLCPLIFGKLIDKKDTTYYLRLSVKSGVGSYRAAGAYLIFDDGEKWIKEDQKLDVSYEGNNRYSYTTFLMLTKDDAKRLITNRITAAKLYSTEIEIKDKDMENFSCSVEKVMGAN